MSCWCQGNKRLAYIEKMREIAKKAAKMEKSVYVLFKKEDGSIWYAKEGEDYKGVFVEYISVIRRIGQYSGCAVRKITGIIQKT